MSPNAPTAIQHLAESLHELVYSFQSAPTGERETPLSAGAPPADLQEVRFKPASERLLNVLLHAPHGFISKEDVRQDVLYDEDASDEAVRSCVRHARRDLALNGLPYKITTIRSKGYKLEIPD